jgi:hypothetical protein
MAVVMGHTVGRAEVINQRGFGLARSTDPLLRVLPPRPRCGDPAATTSRRVQLAGEGMKPAPLRRPKLCQHSVGLSSYAQS